MASMPDYQEWVGRCTQVDDELNPWRAQALAGALELTAEDVVAGDELHPGWHWVYFLEAPRHAELGADGHLARGTFMPPIELPARMWAAGRFRMGESLRLGTPARRSTRIESITPKTGRSGPLCFVELTHEFRTGGVEPALVETQTIVYRTKSPPGSVARPSQPAPGAAEWQREWRADERMLFRYSALTYNAHRIHFDIDYCRDVEGYTGLVVHGPLLATALCELARAAAAEHGSKLTEFEYRAEAPVFHTEKFTACGRPTEVGGEFWIVGADGSVRMRARGTF